MSTRTNRAVVDQGVPAQRAGCHRACAPRRRAPPGRRARVARIRTMSALSCVPNTGRNPLRRESPSSIVTASAKKFSSTSAFFGYASSAGSL